MYVTQNTDIPAYYQPLSERVPPADVFAEGTRLQLIAILKTLDTESHDCIRLRVHPGHDVQERQKYVEGCVRSLLADIFVRRALHYLSIVMGGSEEPETFNDPASTRKLWFGCHMPSRDYYGWQSFVHDARSKGFRCPGLSTINSLSPLNEAGEYETEKLVRGMSELMRFMIKEIDWKARDPEGLTHEDFLLQYEKVWSEMERRLRSLVEDIQFDTIDIPISSEDLRIEAQPVVGVAS